MADILELADRLWRGESDIADHHPLGSGGGLTEVADGVAYVASFARVSAFSTADGLVLVDTGHELAASQIHSADPQVGAQWRRRPPSYGGVLARPCRSRLRRRSVRVRGRREGWPAPTVVAHEAMPARFDRYILTAGYNAVINQRQFGLANLTWPTEYRYPDRTYRDRLELDVGGTAFELHHARGETDDHTWTFVPDHGVLCTGDLFIWASPNAGNPQKVQRYPLEWAAALRTMSVLGAEIMLPGHGFPVVGRERVHEALTSTAELLESIAGQTIALMNSGARLNDVIHSVEMPADLLGRPYLRPVYDDPEFIVRNLWRQYGGWYDGDPSTLKPAPAAALAPELAELAGGAVPARRPRRSPPCGRVERRSAAGRTPGRARRVGRPRRRRCPSRPGGRLRACAREETSTMAKGIFGWAARESLSHLP